MNYLVAVTDRYGKELFQLVFADLTLATNFARSAMFGLNVKNAIVYSVLSGNRLNGFQFDEDGEIESLLF